MYKLFIILSFLAKKYTTNNRATWEFSSEDEDDYLEQPRNIIKCVTHDIDTQSIYGIEVIPQIRRGSEHLIQRTNSLGTLK